jgi:hypothetical protein
VHLLAKTVILHGSVSAARTHECRPIVFQRTVIATGTSVTSS